MSFQRLLLGLSGRIRRGQFWTAIVLWAPIALLAYIIFINAEMQLDPGWNFGGGTRLRLSPHEHAFFLFFFFPLVPITVKRIHDRGRSGWWSLPMIVAPVLILFFALPPWHRGDGWSSEEPWTGLVWSPPELWIGLVAFAFVLLVWWIVELGTRPGTPGPNRYGPAEYPVIGSAPAKETGA